MPTRKPDDGAGRNVRSALQQRIDRLVGRPDRLHVIGGRRAETPETNRPQKETR